MPYRVIELPTPGGSSDEDLLNVYEEAGWTLVDIIQGFTTADESKQARVYWRPRFVFFKAKAGEPRHLDTPSS